MKTQNTYKHLPTLTNTQLLFTSQLQTLSSAHFIGAQLSNRSSKQTACQRFSQELWFSQEVKFMMISWTQTTRFDFTKQLHVNLQKPAFGFIQILLRRRKYILGSKNYFFGHKKLGFWTHTKLYLLTKNLFVWTQKIFLGHKKYVLRQKNYSFGHKHYILQNQLQLAH